MQAVHTWSTFLLSVLFRNHTWELHLYVDNDDNNDNDDNDDDDNNDNDDDNDVDDDNDDDENDEDEDADNDEDNYNNDDNNEDNGRRHTLNLYIYLTSQKGLRHWQCVIISLLWGRVWGG